MKKTILSTAVLFIVIGTLLSSSASSRTDAPLDRVRVMLDRVMSIQTDSKLQGREFRKKRRAGIKGVIARNFDTARMARKALGEHWKQLTETQRAEFKKIFQDLFQDSYTRLVLDFLGKEKIVYGEEDIRRDRAEVPTTILRTNEEIPVNYALVRVKTGWLVYDVKIDGVSIVKNYRRAFAMVIKHESYGALVRKMRLQQKAVGEGS